MFRRTAVRIAVPALAGLGLLLAAGPAGAQQGWPINGSNWSYGGSGRSSSYSPSYYPSYSPSSYSGPVATYGGYYNGAYVSGFMPSASYSYGAYSMTQQNVARIRLTVPTDAQVWFDNNATKQTGATRSFESPPLEPGHQYVYGIKVRWRDKDGQEVTRTRQVDVSANVEVSADFTRQ